MAKAENFAIRRTCELVLLASYTALAEHFKFNQEKLTTYRKHMQRYVDYIAKGWLSREEMIEVLLNEGIDVTKIGDE